MQRISIHAPLRERPRFETQSSRPMQFQSTLPCGSDTSALYMRSGLPVFQSTLPCGSDTAGNSHSAADINFNPRSLAGATLSLRHGGLRYRFQSTLPCGSDYSRSGIVRCPYRISIHAPLRERRILNGDYMRNELFQSTLPCGSDPALSWLDPAP